MGLESLKRKRSQRETNTVEREEDGTSQLSSQQTTRPFSQVIKGTVAALAAISSTAVSVTEAGLTAVW